MPSIYELDQTTDNFFKRAPRTDEAQVVFDYLDTIRRTVRKTLNECGVDIHRLMAPSVLPILGRADLQMEIDEKLEKKQLAGLSSHFPKRAVRGVVGMQLDANADTVINLELGTPQERAAIWMTLSELNNPLSVRRGAMWMGEIPERLHAPLAIVGIAAVAQYAESHPLPAAD